MLDNYLPSSTVHGTHARPTHARPWPKVGRNDPCPCGARHTPEELLERCERGGGKVGRVWIKGPKRGQWMTSLRYSLLQALLSYRVEHGLKPGMPKKLKHCHGTERRLVEEGVLAK